MYDKTNFQNFDEALAFGIFLAESDGQRWAEIILPDDAVDYATEADRLEGGIRALEARGLLRVYQGDGSIAVREPYADVFDDVLTDADRLAALKLAANGCRMRQCGAGPAAPQG